MENRKLEDQIKSIVNSNQPELDHDAIWDNIEPKLKKKKRRRFIILWFLMGGMTLALFQFLLTEKSSMDGQASESSVNQAMPSTLHGDQADQSSTASMSKLSAAVQLVEEERKVGKIDTRHDSQADKTEKSMSRNKTEDLAEANFDKFNTKQNQIRLLENSDQRIVNRGSSPLNSSEDQPIKSEEIGEVIEVANNHVKEAEINAPLNFDRKNNNNNKSKKELHSNGTLDAGGASSENKAETNQSRANEGTGNSGAQKEERPTHKLTNKTAEKKPHEIKKKWRPQGRWQWELQAYAGSAWAINAIKSANGDASNSYAKKRRDSERTLEAYMGGVNVRISNDERKFIALAGIQYRRLNQRFDQESSVSTTETESGVVAVVENATGRIIETETGQKEVTETTVSKYRSFNHYNYFSIPLGVGTKWSERKYSFAVMAGIDYNLGFKFNGTMLRTDDSRISFKDGSNDSYYNKIYKKKSGIDFWITAEYARNLDRRTQVTIAPKFQIPTTSIHKNDFNTSQRFYLFGLDLGLVYVLNR